MSDEAAGAAEGGGEVADAGDAMDKVIERVKARGEAADAEGKATGSAGNPKGSSDSRSTSTDDSSPGSQSTSKDGKSEDKPRKRVAADLAAIARREWDAGQKLKQAEELSQKYQPLDEALTKRDFIGAMNLLADRYGAKFSDFVAALTQEAPPEKSPAEIAAETVAAKLKEAKEADEAERVKRETEATKAAIVRIRTKAQGMAEQGGDRWELTADAEKGGEAWDLIEGWYDATTERDKDGNVTKDGQKLSLEEALDKLEAKLRAKREARRKQGAATPGQAGKSGSEAGAGPKNGRAGAPSFTNRNTSGVPAAVGGSHDDSDDVALPEHEAIDRAARRARIAL